jgi:hypothetical protein
VTEFCLALANTELSMVKTVHAALGLVTARRHRTIFQQENRRRLSEPLSELHGIHFCQDSNAMDSHGIAFNCLKNAKLQTSRDLLNFLIWIDFGLLSNIFTPFMMGILHE